MVIVKNVLEADAMHTRILYENAYEIYVTIKLWKDIFLIYIAMFQRKPKEKRYRT